MLILGSNVYADPVYRLSHQEDRNTGNKTDLFTLENCNGSLILTTEIRGENSKLIVKIDKDELIEIDKNFDVQEEIEKGNGLMLTKKEDGTIIFNAKITENQYVEVTGTFYVGSKKIHITDHTVEINNISRKTVNGVDMHDIPSL